MDIEKLALLKQNFIRIFGDGGDIRCYFAPGRVNLIGEHTDYNGGHVFPCALTIGTYGVARKRNDNKLRFYSVNFNKLGILETDLNHLENEKRLGWVNYPLGVIWAMDERGKTPDCGLDVMVLGTIPNGSGLSSSASIEVIMGFIMNDMFDFGFTNKELALIGQYSENNFNGVNCGIMDQFAIAMGKEDNAIFLDTATLEFEYAPVKLEGMKIVIACSNKKRGLGDSKYNERRAQCEEALANLQKKLDIKSLGELDEATFEENIGLITDPVNRQRAKHAVYENQRTIKAVEALKNNDIETFGKLMNESHVSLRDDYEVTGKELDALVEASWEQRGVIGSRMTGAGFGGCTVSIVNEDDVELFVERVSKDYKEKIGYKADFYVVSIG
ncbi:MAG: galactokinase, partial [Lachnospiraceae bacterium]|nr:galactokinase [Lachnospiraceae bacterium]